MSSSPKNEAFADVSASLRRYVYDPKIRQNWLYSVLVASFCAGFSLATWLTRLPTIQKIMDLSPGELGLLLLASTVGSFLSVMFSGAILLKIKIKTLAFADALIVGTSLVCLGLSLGVLQNYWLSAVFFLTTGLGMGSWGVATNIQGTSVEQASGKPVMPKLHGSFSLGTLVGALLSFAFDYFSLSVSVHFASVGIIIIVVNLFLRKHYRADEIDSHINELYTGILQGTISDPRPKQVQQESPIFINEGLIVNNGSEDSEEDKKQNKENLKRAWRDPRTLLLGVVVLGMALGEGSAGDWIGVSLVKTFGIATEWGSFAYVIFVACMTSGRFAGGVILPKIGRARTLRIGAISAIIGISLFVFSPVIFGQDSPTALIISYLSITLWGLGVCLGFPVTLSAAGDDPVQAAARVSVVSTIGYIAFLCGPPLLGFVGDHVGVRESLLVVLVFITVTFLVIPKAMPRSKKYPQN